MKILVTGGAGFIGSHIVDAYIKAGHRVVVVDDLSSGFKKNVNPKATFYRLNIANFGKLEAVFQKEKPTVVNHQAAMNTWDFYRLEKDTQLFQSDVVGTYNIIALSLKYGVQRLIHASSAAVYGNHKPAALPLKETAETRPISLYGLSKLIAEQLIIFFGKARGLDYLILRYANVYGPRQSGGAISIFLHNMLNHTITKIYGGGKKTRDYVYIDDVVFANMLALKKGKDSVLNIGTGKETGDLELFKTMRKMFDSPHRPVYVEDRTADIKRSSLAYTRARKILGWRPAVSLEKGLRLLLECIQN